MNLVLSMAAIEQTTSESPTVSAIYASYEARNQSSRRLGRRLGASQLGSPCLRRTWYAFRWAAQESFSGRTLRIFDTGHREEPRLIDDLRAIGVTVWDRDEAGNQFEFTDVGGHLVAKVDSVALGVLEAPKTPHACEFKTHNAKSFKALMKDGVKVAKPEHYAQLLIGMLLAKLTRGLYLAVNKDTDELYAERLRLEECKQDAERFLAEAESVVRAPRPPERAGDSPDAWVCKWCPFKATCWGEGGPAPAVAAMVNCRTCAHSTPVVEEQGIGRWVCAKHQGRTLGEAEQRAACPDHLFIPDFIVFASPVDGSVEENWIEYRNSDGVVWRQGAGKSTYYRSTELVELPRELVGLGSVHRVKEELGGEVVGVINE